MWLNVSASHPQTSCFVPINLMCLYNVFLSGRDFEEKAAGNQVITILLLSSNSITLGRDPSHAMGLTSLLCKQHQAPNEILKEHRLLPVRHTWALFNTQTDRISLWCSKPRAPCHRVPNGVGECTFFIGLFVKVNIPKVQLDQVIKPILSWVSRKGDKVAKFEGENLRLG